MNCCKSFFACLPVIGLSLSLAHADERRFTYTYEPETLPKGAFELEQWTTLRAGRNADVGQADFHQWELRQALEYGITDNYTAEVYLNENYVHFRDPSAGTTTSEWAFKGVSVENRYMVLNPAEHALGLTLYLEPRYSGSEFELEEKIIIGQRYGAWKWALNLTHATEWTDYFRATEGELEVSLGIGYDLGSHWTVGIEARDHNELPEYREWENTALFIGPAVSYRRGRWWAALSVLPQVYGANFTGNPDNNPHLDLQGHERLDVRLLFGFGF